jgi:uncharacterized protein YndB with AHSA1/START domain
MTQDRNTTDKPRAFEMTMDLDAPVEQVWAALTTAEELMRWFPLQARVTSGEGGSMHWSWDGAWDWDTRIDVWDPNRRLRLVQDTVQMTDATGKPVPSDDRQPVTLALDFQLETHAGKTRLRLVHSGFGQGAQWDDELDSVSKGWQSEMRSLQHYLRWHHSRDRQVGWVHHATALPQAAAWEQLLGPDAFGVRGGGGALQLGGPYAADTALGDRFSGQVDLYLPPWDFFGTARELHDGTFRLATYRKDGSTGLHVWLASWGGDATAVKSFQTRAGELLQRLFPAASASASTASAGGRSADGR